MIELDIDAQTVYTIARLNHEIRIQSLVRCTAQLTQIYLTFMGWRMILRVRYTVLACSILCCVKIRQTTVIALIITIRTLNS